MIVLTPLVIDKTTTGILYSKMKINNLRQKCMLIGQRVISQKVAEQYIQQKLRMISNNTPRIAIPNVPYLCMFIKNISDKAALNSSITMDK